MSPQSAISASNSRWDTRVGKPKKTTGKFGVPPEHKPLYGKPSGTAPLGTTLESLAVLFHNTAMADPQMRAARLCKPGEPFQIDTIDRPQRRAQDVLVAVKACAIIPAMNAIFSGRFCR